MTRHDIIRMAREAGSIDSEDVIETVYAAFSAAEREACAQYVEQCTLPDLYSQDCLPDIANEIRARGQE
jgi:hypothetical protein